MKIAGYFYTDRDNLFFPLQLILEPRKSYRFWDNFWGVILWLTGTNELIYTTNGYRRELGVGYKKKKKKKKKKSEFGHRIVIVQPCTKDIVSLRKCPFFYFFSSLSIAKKPLENVLFQNNNIKSGYCRPCIF